MPRLLGPCTAAGVVSVSLRTLAYEGSVCIGLQFPTLKLKLEPNRMPHTTDKPQSSLLMTPPKETSPSPKEYIPKGVQSNGCSGPLPTPLPPTSNKLYASPPTTSLPPTSNELYSRKRTYLDFTMPSDGMIDKLAALPSPHKKLKRVLTTVRNIIDDMDIS
jgi:hypothetical protein